MSTAVRSTRLFVSAALGLLACGLRADVEMPAMFADNMLLQRGKPVPVHGQAAVGESVTVEFAGQKRRATAGDDGTWRIELAPLTASATPAEMRISGRNTVVLKNVLVGDLWLASGQSNMGVQVREVNNAEAELKAANYDGIRFYQVKRDLSSSPKTKQEGEWKLCTPDNARTFSAVAYFYARELHTRHGIPIGILQSAVGSSSCEAWVPADVLRSNKDLPQPPDIPPEEYRDLKTYQDVRMKVYRDAAAKDAGVREECLAWATPDHDASGWKEMTVPGEMEARGLNIDGAVWFRCEADLPKDWEGKDASLYLGFIGQVSIAYVNGVEVGRKDNNGGVYVGRTHRIPGKLVRAGRNVVAVRIFNEVGKGGFYPAYPQPLAISQGKAKVLLPESWKYKVEVAFEPKRLARNLTDEYHLPTGWYNGMIAPYISTPVRGFIWYQGESNAGRYEQHDILFPTLIRTWRKLWKDETLPFYFVQLAGYRKPQTQPSEDGWAAFRESQAKALALPHTGMAVTIDIGDATNVHPKNKQDVGRRLARWASRDCYGDTDIAVSGPLYASSTIEGETIRLHFSHVYGGLKAKGGKLEGFAIAGEDKAFVWAKARIDGESVVVWSEAIPKPAYVRYAWANNPKCTLVNAADLPAAPFRTDH
jgi:sialate O-acetylesterase